MKLALSVQSHFFTNTLYAKLKFIIQCNKCFISTGPKIYLANLGKGQKFVYPNKIFFSQF